MCYGRDRDAHAVTHYPISIYSTGHLVLDTRRDNVLHSRYILAPTLLPFVG